MADDVFVHANALNESTHVGGGTRIWAFAHVMKGAKVGRDCNIGDHAFVETGAVLGDGVTLKNGVAVWDGVIIRDFAFVGPYAVFTNDLSPRSPRGPHVGDRYESGRWLRNTLIEEGASIGANATIVCGTRIGTYAMIAAGATVTKDVPPFTLVKGTPARPCGYVCMCGERLNGKSDFTCSQCGKQYAVSGNQIKPVG